MPTQVFSEKDCIVTLCPGFEVKQGQTLEMMPLRKSHRVVHKPPCAQTYMYMYMYTTTTCFPIILGVVRNSLFTKSHPSPTPHHPPRMSPRTEGESRLLCFINETFLNVKKKDFDQRSTAQKSRVSRKAQCMNNSYRVGDVLSGTGFGSVLSEMSPRTYLLCFIVINRTTFQHIPLGIYK